MSDIKRFRCEECPGTGGAHTIWCSSFDVDGLERLVMSAPRRNAPTPENGSKTGPADPPDRRDP